ncbi:MAG TPA: sugar phosphate isomerase/epimerase family protein [Thermoguttaceae bacterium]|nr:sugar phosphate isomerase/epimerase family protein [Thermoguttaceae bacterium]
MSKKNQQGTSDRITRRGMLQGAAGLAAMATAGLAAAAEPGPVRSKLGQLLGRKKTPAGVGRVVVNGRINQSVCDWCFINDCSPKPMTLEELCRVAAAMGIKSVELVQPKDWDTLKKYGLINALAPSHGFVKGFNDPANHEMCIAAVKESIDACAAAGFPSVITFSGFRDGIPDDVGLKNTVAGLKKVIGYAEKKKVNLCIEVLNSRVDVEMKGHPGYMCDKVEWAYEVCEQIASPRMTYLFDVYHVQIMQGDIITRIKDFHKHIGHYHVAGVPGRNELDDNQEINFPPIMRTIVETGYQGYVAQEFIPTRDPLTSLREAVKLCDV